MPPSGPPVDSGLAGLVREQRTLVEASCEVSRRVRLQAREVLAASSACRDRAMAVVQRRQGRQAAPLPPVPTHGS